MARPRSSLILSLGFAVLLIVAVVADTKPREQASSSSTGQKAFLRALGHAGRLGTKVVESLMAPFASDDGSAKMNGGTTSRNSGIRRGGFASGQERGKRTGFDGNSDGVLESTAGASETFGNAVLNNAKGMAAMRNGGVSSASFQTPGLDRLPKRKFKNGKFINVEDDEEAEAKQLKMKTKKANTAKQLHQSEQDEEIKRTASLAGRKSRLRHPITGYVSDPKYPRAAHLKKSTDFNPNAVVLDDVHLAEPLPSERNLVNSDNKEDVSADDNAVLTTGRRFTAQETKTTETGEKYIPRFCDLGAIVVPKGTNMTCNVTFLNTTAGEMQNQTETITTDLFITMNNTERAKCWHDSTEEQCVCPKDFELTTSVFGDVDCLQKRTDCTARITDPVRNCPPRTELDVVRDDVCVRFPKRQENLTVAVSVNCFYIPFDLALYASLGVTFESPPDEDLQWVVAKVGKRAKVAAFTMEGNYDKISRSFFAYDTVGKDTDGFFLSNSNSFVTRGQLFMQVYNFRHFSDQRFFFRQSVKDLIRDKPFVLSGDTDVKFTFRPSHVPEEFFTARRLYLEAGIMVFGVAVDRMHIDYDDVPVRDNRPPEGGLQGGALIAVIVVSCVVGLLLILAIVLVYRRHVQEVEKETSKGLGDDDELD